MKIAEDLRDDLHAASIDDAAWPALLTRLSEVLKAREAVLGGGVPGQNPEMVSPRFDPSHASTYFETYHEQNRLMHAIMRGGIGQVIAAEALPEFEPFLSSNFYNLWCRPQRFHYAYGFNLQTSTGWAGTLIVNDERSVTSECIEGLQALAPLVARSMETNKFLGQLRSANRVTLEMLELAGQGGMLLDRAGRPLEVNATAQAMLRDGRLGLKNGALAAPEQPGAAELARLIARCIKTPDQAGGRVTLEGAGGPIVVQCVPFPGSLAFPAPQRPAVAVIISDPQHRLRQRLSEVANNYGLTRAEAELALAVVQAGSRKRAAALRSISDLTARSQLSSIFDKTGVRRQTDLVRLLLGE